MHILLPYALKGFLLSGMLTGYYYIALRNTPLHYFNRVFLLVTIMISLAAPLVHFSWPATPPAQAPAINHWLNDLSSGTLPERAFDGAGEAWITIVWMGISLFLFGVLLLKTARILSLKRKYATQKRKGYYFIETELPEAPFSFFNYLVWKKDIPAEGEYGKKIIQHELAHIRQGHTYDQLFSHAIACLFWMNPFYWIIQKELNMVHEFIADEKSIQDRDTASFAEMLLLSVGNGSYLQPGHSFFQSPLKRRIRMLGAATPVNYLQVRKWIVLPLCFFGLSLVSLGGRQRPAIGVDDMIHIFSQDEALTDTVIDSAKQKPQEWTPARTHQLVVQIVKNPPDVLFYVNGVITPREKIKKLDPDKITTMNIFKGKDAIRRHGEKAKNGVIEFTTP